jgi:ribose-phosphate pyrophosphokinase
MKNFIIFTSTTEHLKESLIKKTKGVEFVFLEKNKEGKRNFPDGETYIRISRVRKMIGGRVVVLHSGSPNPNEGIVELEMVLQILKDYKIEPEVFFTYFPYGQQDKIFLKGEENAAENLIRKIIDYYSVDKIYAIEPHFGKMRWVERYPFVEISAVPLLLKKVKKDFKDDILFLSPDKGGKRRTGISGLKKKRQDSFNVELSLDQDIDLKGKNVGLVDDILETGGTLIGCYKKAKSLGAKEVIALITHGPLESGMERVEGKFSNLYLTNTIKNKRANIDISSLIAGVL